MRPDDRARATLSASETASAVRASPRCPLPSEALCALVMTSVGCSSFSEMTSVVPSALRRTFRTIRFTTRFLRRPFASTAVSGSRESSGWPSRRARAASSSKTPRSRVHPPRPPTCPTASVREPRDDPSSCAVASVPRSPSARRGDGRSAPWDEKTLKATRNAARKASAGTRRPAIVSSAVGAPRRRVVTARASRERGALVGFPARRRSTRRRVENALKPRHDVHSHLECTYDLATRINQLTDTKLHSSNRSPVHSHPGRGCYTFFPRNPHARHSQPSTRATCPTSRPPPSGSSTITATPTPRRDTPSVAPPHSAASSSRCDRVRGPSPRRARLATVDPSPATRLITRPSLRGPPPRASPEPRA